MRPKHLTDLLKIAIPQKRNVLVVGGPGVGKSDIITDTCKQLGAKLIISHPVVSDPTDYKGMPFVVQEGDQSVAKFLPFSDLKELINAKELTVFFLDDLGQAPSSVQAAVMQLLLARRLNDHIISENVVFIAATNRRQDKAGVMGILEPVKSRFCTIVEIEPELDDWVEWAISHDMPMELIAFVRFRESNNQSVLYNFKPTLDISNGPCPRTVANVGRWMKDGLPKHLEFETFKGAAGEVFATEFLAFLQIARSLPDPDDFIQNPRPELIPKEPSTMFALLGAIAHRLTPQTAPNIIKIANMLPPEFSVMLVKDCLTKDKKAITRTEAFIDWSVKYSNLYKESF